MQQDVSHSSSQSLPAAAERRSPASCAPRGWWVAMLGAAMLASGATFWSVHAAPEAELSPEAARHASELSSAFRFAAEKVSPTVVKITTVSRAPSAAPMRFRGNADPFGASPFEGTPFEDLFKGDNSLRNFREFRSIPAPRAQQGLGSGVIIDSAGIILTNNHVVSGADEVFVRLTDGREFKATDIRVDPQTDLAVIRIHGAGNLPAAKLGRSSEMEIGDWVIAIGHPFSLDTTVSAGIISGKGRGLANVSRAQFLQTDAAINPGNSGGPLVNLRGEVVGINTAIATNSGGYQGIGFAVPVDLAKWVIDQLSNNGTVKRAYLGVKIEALTNELAKQFQVPGGKGVLVAEVNADAPAARAGMKEGDVVVSFEGQAVESPRDLQSVVERAPVDKESQLRVVRDGKELDLKVKLDYLPEDLVVSSQPMKERSGSQSNDSYRAKELGLELSTLTDSVAAQLGFEGFRGVLISHVEPGSVAERQGLREGMLVLKVNRTEVTTLAEFQKVLENASLADGILLQVRSEEGNRFVVLSAQG